MKTFIILFFLLILAFFLRSQAFFHGDFFYSVDQSRDLLLAKSVAFDHKLTLIGGRTGFGGLFHGALWIYMIVPFFVFFKGNPFLTLIPLYEIVNLGTILAGFYVGLRLYGKLTGLLFAYFLAISKTLVNASMGTTNAEVLPIVVIFYLFSIFKFLRGDDKFFAFSLFLTGLGFQFESAFAVLLIPLTLFAVVLKKKLPSFKIILTGIFGFFLAVSTFILFDLRHNFLMTLSFLRFFTNIQKPLPGYEQYSNLGFRVIDRLSGLLNSFFSPLYSKDLLASIFIVLFIFWALIFISIYRTKESEVIDKEYFFVFFSPFLIFGIYILYPLPLWTHYILPVSIFAILILCLSIKRLWQISIAKPLILFFMILTFLPVIFYFFHYNLNREYLSNSDGSYLNQLNVANWVINDSRNKISSYFVYSPGILTYNMDYLFWWLAKKNNRTQMLNAKTSNTYLIMYPPSPKDNRAHEFWKKNVIHTNASPELVKTFPGNIIVEKINLSEDTEPVDPNYFQNLLFR